MTPHHPVSWEGGGQLQKVEMFKESLQDQSHLHSGILGKSSNIYHTFFCDLQFQFISELISFLISF